MLGIKHFIRQGWAEGVAGAIVCEPEALELCLFQKGALRVEALATGKMAHGAMPYAGVNPVPVLMDFLAAVRSSSSPNRPAWVNMNTWVSLGLHRLSSARPTGVKRSST